MNWFTDHYPGGFRRHHPYGNLQPLPGPVNDRHCAVSSLRSAKDLNGSTVERVERIEDLDLSVFCTQGIVGVGVTIPTSTVWLPLAASPWTTSAGFLAAIASSFPSKCLAVSSEASSSLHLRPLSATARLRSTANSLPSLNHERLRPGYAGCSARIG